MATIPSQRTFVTGEVVTAAELNSNVRDAVNFLLNPPHCEIYANANQSISASSFTLATMGNVTEDNDSMAAGNWINPQTNGRYLVQIQVSWDGTSTGGRGVFLDKGGSYFASATQQADASDSTRQQISRTMRLVHGDSIGAAVWTSAAASLVTNSYGNSFVSATFVGT